MFDHDRDMRIRKMLEAHGYGYDPVPDDWANSQIFLPHDEWGDSDDYVLPDGKLWGVVYADTELPGQFTLDEAEAFALSLGDRGKECTDGMPSVQGNPSFDLLREALSKFGFEVEQIGQWSGASTGLYWLWIPNGDVLSLSDGGGSVDAMWTGKELLDLIESMSLPTCSQEMLSDNDGGESARPHGECAGQAPVRATETLRHDSRDEEDEFYNRVGR